MTTNTSYQCRGVSSASQPGRYVSCRSLCSVRPRRHLPTVVQHTTQYTRCLDKNVSDTFVNSLNCKQLRISVALLTGHTTLNRHLTVMKIRTNPLCPACAEEEETTYHFLGKCCADMLVRYSIMGAYLMEPAELSKLKPARASIRGFYNLWLYRGCTLGQTNMPRRWTVYYPRLR